MLAGSMRPYPTCTISKLMLEFLHHTSHGHLKLPGPLNAISCLTDEPAPGASWLHWHRSPGQKTFVPHVDSL